jgi:hypothetical protein
MTQPIGITGAPYNTQIPTLAENADIQAALRVFHYGSDTDNPGINPPSNSIAGHLKNLETTKIAKAVTQIASGSSDPKNNLNDVDYRATGYYAATNPVSGGNYPTFRFNDADTSPTRYSGLLQVVVDGTAIYQTYIAQIPSSPDNKVGIAVRGFYSGGWTPWRQLLDDNWNYNNTYYTKLQTYTRTEINSIRDTLDQDKISAGTGTGANSLPQKIYVQASEPTSGMVAGDLWFW